MNSKRLKCIHVFLLVYLHALIQMNKTNKRRADDEISIETNKKKTKVEPPKVVHLRRKNGKIVEDCDIYIGRVCNMGGWRLTQSKWQNPFPVKKFGRDESLKRYKDYIEKNTNNLYDQLEELAGKRLGCWCKPERCHGDVLRELFIEKCSSNSEETKVKI